MTGLLKVIISQKKKSIHHLVYIKLIKITADHLQKWLYTGNFLPIDILSGIPQESDKNTKQQKAKNAKLEKQTNPPNTKSQQLGYTQRKSCSRQVHTKQFSQLSSCPFERGCWFLVILNYFIKLSSSLFATKQRVISQRGHLLGRHQLTSGDMTSVPHIQPHTLYYWLSVKKTEGKHGTQGFKDSKVQ